MSYIVIRCADCRDHNNRPKLYRFSCDDCRQDFIDHHHANFPDHRLMTPEWLRDGYVRVSSRAARRLMGRAQGW